MRIDTVPEYARRACDDERNVFGASFFSEHLAVAAACASKLATPLGADPEAVCDVAMLPRHAEAGAELGGRVLNELGWPN